jgi:hypothetical protein
MRLLKSLRLGPPAVICALATHAVVYRTFWPSDGVHGYFGWYEPLSGALSAVALLALGLMLVFGLAGNAHARRVLAACAAGGRSAPARAYRLALATIAILVVQESIETSVAAGRPVLGMFSGASLLFAVAAAAVLSALFVCAARSYERLAERIVARARSTRHLGGLKAARARRLLLSHRPRSPLADFRGLRAPPLPAS